MHKLWKDAAGKLGIVILPKQEHENLNSALAEMTERASYHERGKKDSKETLRETFEILKEERFSAQGLQDQINLLKHDNEEKNLLIRQQARRIETLKKKAKK
jgi:hypothetical protein